MTLDGAVIAGDVEAARTALRSGAHTDRRNPDGFTPLILAAGLGQVRMVELLLSAGADPLAMDARMGATALHKAAQSGNPEIIDLLLASGAFVDHQSPVLGNTPLIDATLHKHEASVRLLLDRGARTTIRNHWGQSALELAREEGLEAIARAIEAHDRAKAKQLAGLALITAITSGDMVEAGRLIANGAEVDERIPALGTVEDDYTPLGIAVRKRLPECVSLLLQVGADPNRKIGLMRGTVLHEASFLGYADILLILLKSRDQADAPAIDLDEQGPYNGLTPLHDAVWHGHVDAARVLIEAGASMNLRSHSGLTPRELATLYGYDDLARVLAEAEIQHSIKPD